MKLDALVARLDDRLRVGEFADVDASANGLQVGPVDPAAASAAPSPPAGDDGAGGRTDAGEGAGVDVERAALAVDAAVATAEAAADRDADLLVAHHGIVWGGLDRVTGRTYDRVATFLDADVALYAAHLPLDAHPELGNAAGLGDAIGVVDREPFGSLGGQRIGLRGRFEAPRDPDGLRERLAEAADPAGGVDHLDFGPDAVESVAVLTGAGADWLDEAARAGVDAFVTGEGKQQLYHQAREAGLHAYLAGHYATETYGVRRVGETLEGWGVETTFLDHPTGL